MSLVLTLLLTGIACICSGVVQWISQCKSTEYICSIMGLYMCCVHWMVN